MNVQFSPQRFREACEGHRPERVAVAADVSTKTLQMWKAGKRTPNVCQLAAIASYLKRPIDFFYVDEAA